jgi:hypothetical protein
VENPSKILSSKQSEPAAVVDPPTCKPILSVVRSMVVMVVAVAAMPPRDIFLPHWARLSL